MDAIAGPFNVLYQLLDSFAFLALAAVGLAIIFGMMGVINLAHGEFMMIGAYVTAAVFNAGLPLVVAVLAGSVAAAAIGAVLERLIIRHLYHRPLDSILATWGLSLILSQGMLIWLGPSFHGIGTPPGSFTVGNSTYSVYRVVLAAISLAVLVFLWWLYARTTYGLRARATVQNAEIARALGINVRQMYLATFTLGSALAGLAGGLYAPTRTIVPTFGASFIVPAMVTVIVGGANALLGTLLSALSLGSLNGLLSMLFGTLIGQLGLLVAVIVVIRVLPKGITAYVGRVD